MVRNYSKFWKWKSYKKDLRLLKAVLKMGLNSIYEGLIDHFFATTFLVVTNCPMLYGGLKTVRLLRWL